MEKKIRCASCDEVVEPAEKCHCGNTIAGFCRAHKVLYDLNVLPQCPICIRDDITPGSSEKLKALMRDRKRGTVLVITAKDGIRMDTQPEPRMTTRSSYYPTGIASSRPRPHKPLPLKVAARLGSGTGVM